MHETSPKLPCHRCTVSLSDLHLRCPFFSMQLALNLLRTTFPLRTSERLALGTLRTKDQTRLHKLSSPPRCAFKRLPCKQHLISQETLSPQHHSTPFPLQHLCLRAAPQLSLRCLRAHQARSHRTPQVRISPHPTGFFHFQRSFFLYALSSSSTPAPSSSPLNKNPLPQASTLTPSLSTTLKPSAVFSPRMAHASFSEAESYRVLDTLFSLMGAIFDRCYNQVPAAAIPSVLTR